MLNLKMKFGFYPKRLEIESGPVKVQELPGLEKTVKSVLESGAVANHWIYPHSRQNELPYPSRVFGLPHTHVIEHTAATCQEHLEFHLWALSLFVGNRLTGCEAGFLDSTPVRPGALVDFRVGASLAKALELAEQFWNTNQSKPLRARRFAAAVHALFLGQSRQGLQFENFLYLYLALDACYKLCEEIRCEQRGQAEFLRSSKQLRHCERIQWMCNQFAIPTPLWADPTAHGGAKVAAIRNDTIHEALFMGAPLGFEIHEGAKGGDLTIEMAALVCRLLVAIIGGDRADYVHSPVDTAQMCGLDLS